MGCQEDTAVEPRHPRRRMCAASDAGILPKLIFMLERIACSITKFKMCEQRDCGTWFKVERGRQRFGSPDCSQRQRQRDYWESRGKELRIERLRKRKEKGGK